MKNIILITSIISLILVSTNVCFAQRIIDDKQKDGIVLNSYISTSQTDIPAPAKNILLNKLNTIASQNGMGGDGLDPRFIITPNVTVLAKEITPTAPPMVSMILNVSLFIGDGITGTLFSTIAMEVTGVGTNDTKAYISALRKINTSNPSIRELVNEGKTKIINYFNSQCNAILKKAEMLESQNRYQEAIIELASIPAPCIECYNKSANKIGPVYQKYINKECKSDLILAQNAWNVGQDLASANDAAEFLGRIDPASTCYREALAFSKEIGKRVKALDQREWDFKLKEAEDDINLQRDLAQAARDAVVSIGENQPMVEYDTESWY